MIKYYILKNHIPIHYEHVMCDYYTRTKTS
jgi:hypothetical protein